MDDSQILSMLKRLEWCAEDCGSAAACPDCGSTRDLQPHSRRCELNNAIQHLEARTKAVRPQSDKAVRLREDK